MEGHFTFVVQPYFMKDKFLVLSSSNQVVDVKEDSRHLRPPANSIFVTNMVHSYLFLAYRYLHSSYFGI